MSLLSSFFLLRRPPRFTLFPYTTLFRSLDRVTKTTVFLADLADFQAMHSIFTLAPRSRGAPTVERAGLWVDRKSTRLNSSHRCISYAVFCLKKKKNDQKLTIECKYKATS